MTRECKELVINQTDVTLAEYVWTHTKALLVKWGWIQESDAIPSSITLDPVHEEKLSKARKDLEDALALSDQDAQKGCEQYHEDQQAIVARCKNLLTQAEAWQLSADQDDLKQRIVGELRRAAEQEEPVSITPEQYKRTKTRVAIEQLDEAEKLYRHNVEAQRSVNATLAALRQSFGDPPAAKAE